MANIIRIVGDTEQYKRTSNDSHYGFAFTDMRACAVQIDAVRKCFREDSEFAWKMFSMLSDRCKDILNSLALLTERSGAGKIAWVLDKLEEVGVDPTTVTHETISRLLNMNRVSVTRIMSSALDQRLSK